VNTPFTRVSLDELDRKGQLTGLSTAAAKALDDTGLVEVRPVAPGQWRLLPRGYVGAVRIDDLQVQVTPKEKVRLDRLLFLLGYAHDPGFRPEDVAGIEEPELWPALAESLARLTEAALAGGILQGYRTVEESLRTIRGRIRLGDQITRRPGLTVPIEVIYDDFTADGPPRESWRL
jgi:5-methylcytosine-specific restriction enzyme subunit McrC